MTIASQIAKHLRDVHFGGNWTCVNFKDTLAGVTMQQATTKVRSFNTIATLMNHMYYYLAVVQRVVEGGPVEGKDELSFLYEPYEGEEQWQAFLEQVWVDVEALAKLIEQLPDNRLNEMFYEEKYGTYFRHLLGMIEHCHYHLGQIVIIKKLLSEE